MKLGIVCYAENTGLGMLSHDFYEYLQPAKVMLLDRHISRGNEFYPERYDDPMIINGLPTLLECGRFLDSLDIVLMFEVSPTDILLRLARQRGVKTVIMPNYEYCTYVTNAGRPLPDLLLAPSLWHYDEYPGLKKFLPVPIAPKLTKKRRKTAYKFLHIGGRPVFPDRNGTQIVLDALQYVEEPIDIMITCTDSDYLQRITKGLKIPAHVEYTFMGGEVKDMDALYDEHDVLLMPRRFGGLCLPVNEAIGHGLPTIMSDVDPNNTWLPKEWLVPAHKTDERKMAAMIDVFTADSWALAQEIDRLATDAEFFDQCDTQARELAYDYSWAEQVPKYIETLGNMIPLALRD